LLWENDGYQWYRFEGLQNDLPYTTCAVCNQNPLLLRAIYKYEKLQQPELYQSCPPDEGNDIQPNKTMSENKLASKKQKMTQTINTESNEITNDNIIQKDNNISIQQETNLNATKENNDNFIQKDNNICGIQPEKSLNATKENNDNFIQKDNNTSTTNSVRDETTTEIDTGLISTGTDVLEGEKKIHQKIH
jgi:hypothetical protein